MLLNVIRYFSLSPSPSFSSSLSRARLNCGQAGLPFICVCLMSMCYAVRMVFFFHSYTVLLFIYIFFSAVFFTIVHTFAVFFCHSQHFFPSSSSFSLNSRSDGVIMDRCRSFFRHFFFVSFHEPNSLSIECVCINSPQNFTSL